MNPQYGGLEVTGPQRNPWLVLSVLCLAIFMLLLDTTIVNVAQREIQLGLDASLTQIQWVLDSYILTYAVLLLTLGRLGDVFGRRRLFIIGMAIFTAASALCGASAWLGDLVGLSGVNALILARVLQGLGGAFMMPQTLSMISVVFPPEKRGAAMGIWGGITALGAVVGPIIGGLIVTNYAWEWVFLINIPVGIAAIVATILIVPESRDRRASRAIDWAGVLLSGGGIFAFTFASIEGNHFGWTSPTILALYAAAVILIAAFIWWERRTPNALMRLELFKIRNFSVGTLIGFIVAFGMLGIFFPMTLYLQGVLGFSPIRAGLTMAPMSVTIMMAAPLAGRFTDRVGPRWILFGGLALVTTGILLIVSQVNTETTWQRLFAPLMVTGLGMGLTFAPMTAAAMREVPQHIAGSASGIINTARNVGQVLGIAILGSVLQARLGDHAAERLGTLPLDTSVRADLVELAQSSRFDELPRVLPTAQSDLLPQVFHAVQLAFVDSLHTTFLVGALACVVGAASALLIRNPRRVTTPAVQTHGPSAGASAGAGAGAAVLPEPQTLAD